MKTLKILFVITLTSVVYSCGGGGGADKPDGPITPAVVSVTSISLSKTSAELAIGKTLQLTATVSPSNATDKTVTWSSSSTTVASVSPTGLVTAIAEGSSNITASCGGKIATCKITVVKPTVAVTSVELDQTDITLKKGDSQTLKATVKPDNATDKNVTWTSSKTDVATVDNAGKVTAVAKGVSTITASCSGKTATCKVNVTVPVESVTLSQTSASLKVNETVTLTATVKPDDATDKTVTWSTSDGSVATVSNGVVTAKKVGTATITAKAGDKTATCEITVIVSGGHEGFTEEDW
ncbi:MAG: Ig domain-containing protein [Bacteroidales bacterium]|nr:Ig domain-containing protein [Bacteroidales bacterium]